MVENFDEFSGKNLTNRIAKNSSNSSIFSSVKILHHMVTSYLSEIFMLRRLKQLTEKVMKIKNTMMQWTASTRTTVLHT